MKSRTFFGRLAMGVGASMLLASSAAAAPSHITYTGELFADNGLPYTGAVMAMAHLYSTAASGSALWSQDLGEVTVMGGVLQVDLMGSGLMGVLADASDLWIEFEIDGETLAPRQKLSAAPYAMIAGNAAMLGGTPAANYVTDATIGDFIDGDSLPTDGINQVSNGALKNHFASEQRSWAGGSGIPIPDFDPFVPGTPAMATFQTGEAMGSYFTSVSVGTEFTINNTGPQLIRVTLTPPPATGVAPIVLVNQVLNPGTYAQPWTPASVPEMQGLLGNPAGGQWTLLVEDLNDSAFGSATIGTLTSFNITYDVIRSNHMVVDGRLDVNNDLYVDQNAYVTGDVTANSYHGDGSNLTGFTQIRNVTTHVHATRVVLGNKAVHTFVDFAVDKKSPTSYLLCEATIPGFGNNGGSNSSGWKYGTDAIAVGQAYTYDENSHSKLTSSRVVIMGHTETGPQSMKFQFYSNTGSGDGPFAVLNPNSSDDSRLAQMRSTYVVWEIEP